MRATPNQADFVPVFTSTAATQGSTRNYGFAMDYNAYREVACVQTQFQTCTVTDFLPIYWDPGVGGHSDNADSFALWRAYTGQDAHSIFAESDNALPFNLGRLFTSRNNDNGTNVGSQECRQGTQDIGWFEGFQPP